MGLVWCLVVIWIEFQVNVSIYQSRNSGHTRTINALLCRRQVGSYIANQTAFDVDGILWY